MHIPMTTSVELIKTLIANDILLVDYKPAYDGESVGLDLFNASDKRFSIPPMTMTLPTTEDLTRQAFEKSQVKTLIPTGVRIALPRNHVALLRERGSITKTPLICRAGVIDPGYTGEIFVNMVNTSSEYFIIEPHSKLPVQLLVVPALTDFEHVTQSKYKELTAEAARGTGMIGSSD